MLVSYLLKPSVHGHSLDELALERLARKPLTPKEWAGTAARSRRWATRASRAYAGERVASHPPPHP